MQGISSGYSWDITWVHKIYFLYKTLSDSSIDELKRDDESDNCVCSVTMVAIVFKNLSWCGPPQMKEI